MRPRAFARGMLPRLGQRHPRHGASMRLRALARGNVPGRAVALPARLARFNKAAGSRPRNETRCNLHMRRMDSAAPASGPGLALCRLSRHSIARIVAGSRSRAATATRRRAFPASNRAALIAADCRVWLLDPFPPPLRAGERESSSFPFYRMGNIPSPNRAYSLLIRFASFS